MKTVFVSNTAYVITEYKLGDAPRLERYFTMYDAIVHERYHKAMYYDEENKCLYLPKGIDKYFIAKYIPDAVFRDIPTDGFKQTGEILLRYLPRDDIQKETLRFIIGRGEYYSNKNKSQFSVNLNTGAGKTYVTIASIAYWSARSIIIASTNGWIEQWRERFKEYTNVDDKEILSLTGAPAIHKVLKGITNPNDYKMFLVTHASLNSFGKKFGWDKISELFKKLNVFLKVFDEAHLNFDNISNIDFVTNTAKTIYLTATPARSDEVENFIYRLYFKNIPKINLFNEDDDPRTRYTAIRFNSRPTPIDRSNCFNNIYGLNRMAYISYIVTKQEFYNVMYIVMEIILNKINGKCLLYIGTNDAILKVKDWMENEYPEVKGEIGVYTSIIDENEKQEALNKRIILSTTKSAGAAIDISHLKATFVIAEPFKSEVLARQTLGRTRDKDTDYFELVDDAFNPISRYYNSKKDIFRKYAVSCKEIKINYSVLEQEAERLSMIRKNVKWQYSKGLALINYNESFKIPK